MNFLDDTELWIPSRSRGDFMKMITMRQMETTLQREVRLAVPNRQAHEYYGVQKKLKCYLIHVPDVVKGIAETREWIFKKAQKKYVIMMDDDMYFFRRPAMAYPRLTKCGPSEVTEMLQRVRNLLEDYPMVGVSARQGNNLVNDAIVKNTRAMNFYGFNRKVILKRVELGRVKVMEDFDLTLQLLRQGYENAVLYRYAWNQSGSGNSGGCSDYRTAEVQAKAAKKLARLHPGLVRVTEKKSKAVWKGMETRTDVVVSWKKAAKEGSDG